MVINNDDRDMKIFVKAQAEPLSDLNSDVAEELIREKSSGNLERAKKLGAEIALDVLSQHPQGKFYFLNLLGSFELTENLVLQCKLLRAFVVDHQITGNISSPVLSFTALNSYYDTLKGEAPVFYDSILNDRAFSYYFLAVRTEEEMNLRIGKTFAMLCDREEDYGYQKLGDTLYTRFSKAVKKFCDAADFCEPATLQGVT